MTIQSPNESDLFSLKENYSNHIIDSMDMDSLVQFAFDNLIEYFKDHTWDDMCEEIKDLYDEDTLIDLLPDQADVTVEEVSTTA
jgi:hypothetical protein